MDNSITDAFTLCNTEQSNDLKEWLAGNYARKYLALIPYLDIQATVPMPIALPEALPAVIALPEGPVLKPRPKRVFQADAPTEPRESANRNITNDIC